MEPRQARTELEEVRPDLLAEEKPDVWISGNASSQALLLAAKKENRLEKHKVFNGFVLEQRSRDDNEFLDFITLLKQNASSIPEGTRIQLAVLTKYVDPDTDAFFYMLGDRDASHWTAVDILVGKNGEISSFVLDATNSYGFKGIHKALEDNFSLGKHYVYKRDEFFDAKNKRTRVRAIQTQDKGCRVFVTEHLKQLSQISSQILYGVELPALDKSQNGEITASSFEGKTVKLSRIFRGMQSWSMLNSLGAAVLNTPLKMKKGKLVTLKASAKSRSKGEINETIAKKNEHYKGKKKEYVQTHSEALLSVIKHRRGEMFLKHPILFELNKKYAENKEEEINKFTQSLIEILNKIPESSDLYGVNDTHIRDIIELKEKIRNEPLNLIMNLADLFYYFDLNNLNIISSEIEYLVPTKPLEEKSEVSHDQKSTSHINQMLLNAQPSVVSEESHNVDVNPASESTAETQDRNLQSGTESLPNPRNQEVDPNSQIASPEGTTINPQSGTAPNANNQGVDSGPQIDSSENINDNPHKTMLP